MLDLEWDVAKAESNLRKHGVSFTEAATALGDPLSVTTPDPDHSEGEERFVLIGHTASGRLVVVVHTERGDTIRLISARPATLHEQREYQHGQ